MKKKSIFIIDDNLPYINELTREFSKQEDLFVVGFSLNGEEALEKLKMYNDLDVLIINSVLPKRDGYDVLKNIKNYQDIYPNINLILVHSSLVNDYVLNKMSNVGVHHFIPKPSNIETLINHIRMIDEKNIPIKQNDDSINIRITRLLHSLGIPAHIKGYHYIRTAVEMTIDNPSIIGQVTKTLYPNIALEYCSSSTKVERAIRHAIELGWTRGNPDVINQIFGYTISSFKAKPTNSEFIAMLADYIKLQEDLELFKERNKKSIKSYI